MKAQTIFKLTTLTFSAALLLGCGNDENAAGSMSVTGKETALEHTQKHQDPKYVCPMHPQIVKDEPGSCPICGMDLVLKEAEETSDATERKILYYRHPHNPSITSDKPKQDEMGMDYVAIYDDGGGVSVKISPAVENNMGVRTAVAEYGQLWRRIDTVGYVDFDENKITHLHLRTQGWIEKLAIKSEGERVQKGDLLFEVYAPELVNAQEEYLQALGTGNQRLISASYDRLIAMGISEKQIKDLKRTRRVNQYVQVYAKHDGIVANLKVREGMHVTPMTQVMSLADLSSVWMLAEVFEQQADWVSLGQSADVKLSYLPGKTFEGKVEYIYPSLDPKTRTLRVRLRFDNPDESLKPGMFADVVIYGGARKGIITIPREAVIRTGQDERVIISQGKGRFIPRTVVTGIESGDWVEVQRGLDKGDIVVTSGQFLIDSEASLKASLARMTAPQNKQENTSKEMVMDKKITGTGILREVLSDANKVNMTHDPIPAIGWPDMTMYFKVKPDVNLNAFKPDDKVEFDLEEGADGFEIKAMRKAAQ